MALPRSRKDREYQKFVDDGSGNVAIRAVIQGGSTGGGTNGLVETALDLSSSGLELEVLTAPTGKGRVIDKIFFLAEEFGKGGTFATGSFTIDTPFAGLVGQTVAIGGFSVVEGVDWTVGADADETASNLYDALVTAGAGVIVGLELVANVINLTSTSAGASGNFTTLTTTAASGITLSGATLSGGTDGGSTGPSFKIGTNVGFDNYVSSGSIFFSTDGVILADREVIYATSYPGFSVTVGTKIATETTQLILAITTPTNYTYPNVVVVVSYFEIDL